MTLISNVPERSAESGKVYRAVSKKAQSMGRTAGEALDALTAQLAEDDAGTWLVVQHLRPDQYFTEVQRQRLKELMARWRVARDCGG